MVPPFVINIIGTTIGLILVCLIAYILKSLKEPILRKYFRWMLIGSTSLFLGFASEFLPESAFENSVHHFFLILSAVIFVITNLIIIDEIGQLVKPTKESKNNELTHRDGEQI